MHPCAIIVLKSATRRESFGETWDRAVLFQYPNIVKFANFPSVNSFEDDHVVRVVESSTGTADDGTAHWTRWGWAGPK